MDTTFVEYLLYLLKYKYSHGLIVRSNNRIVNQLGGNTKDLKNGAKSLKKGTPFPCEDSGRRKVTLFFVIRCFLEEIIVDC